LPIPLLYTFFQGKDLSKWHWQQAAGKIPQRL